MSAQGVDMGSLVSPVGTNPGDGPADLHRSCTGPADAVTDGHPGAPATSTSDQANLAGKAARATIDERIRQHIGLVGILVAERLRTVPTHVTRDDLMSAGMTALVLSARAFDSEFGVPFPVFASFRIRGALLDELRSMDWTSRAVRARAREIETVSAELTTALARPPRTDEIAKALGITTREVERVNSDIERGPVSSLHSLATDLLPHHAEIRTPCPESLILKREQMGYLHDAIGALPERLKFVVVAYYFHQRPMTDIAAELSVTQSRVSQMCAEALTLLRDGMNSQLDPDVLPPLATKGRAAAARRAYYQAMAERNTFTGRLAMSTAEGHMRHGVGSFAAVGTEQAQPALAG